MASITSPITAGLTAVELFAGIGATTLALDDLGVSTVAHAETDAYASAVYAKRFPGSVALGDVTAVESVPACDVIAGGFPCQDISNAGRREGIGGARSGLWSEFARLIGQARPRIVLIENVSALLSRGLDVVLADLCALGYAAEWDCVPAAAVGAPHLRDRVWITAYPEDDGPVRADPLERSLATLAYPPPKWPRAGRMEQGAVYVRTPLAPRKTRRLNPGSAWVGARLFDSHGWWHERRCYPTPTARDWKDTGENTDYASGAEKSHLAGVAVQMGRGLWPTPAASMAARGGRGDLLQAVRGNESPSGHFSAPRGLWPTPTSSPNSNRTTKPAPSHGAGHGRVLAGEAHRPEHEIQRLYLTPTASPWDHGGGGGEPQKEVNATQEAEGKPRGALNPAWVEWLMGFPLGHTDLACDTPSWHGWNNEPRGIPRVAEGVTDRKGRLTCLGNGQVPQVMRWWAAPAIERLR